MRRELAFATALLSCLRGLPIPQPLSLDGKNIFSIASHPAIIYRYLPGRTLTKPSLRQIESVGSFLANFHKQTEKFRFPGRKEPLYRFSKSQYQLFIRTVNKSHMPHLDHFRIIAKDVRRYKPHPRLPQGPIHVDVKPENVLFHKGKLSGVIDFDNAYFGPQLLDLAKSMAWFGLERKTFNLNKALAVWRGYTKVRQLTALEYQELYSLLRFAFASHLFVDYYRRAIKMIPPSYFKFLLNDFYGGYRSFVHINKDNFYTALKQVAVSTTI
jgi:homoserine kinase type II